MLLMTFASGDALLGMAITGSSWVPGHNRPVAGNTLPQAVYCIWPVITTYIAAIQRDLIKWPHKTHSADVHPTSPAAHLPQKSELCAACCLVFGGWPGGLGACCFQQSAALCVTSTVAHHHRQSTVLQHSTDDVCRGATACSAGD